MKFRTRQRWLRRFALGLAFATMVGAGAVAPASAKPDDGSTGSRYIVTEGWSGLVDRESGIPLSAGIPDAEAPAVTAFVPGVTDFPRAAVAQQPASATETTTLEWGDGVPVALAAVALAFALGLWFGYARRAAPVGH